MISELDIQIQHRLIEALAEKEQLAAELQRAKDASDSANLAKSCFLATVSHEIRTPMNGILGMAQLLLMPGITEEERHDYARIILNSGQTLLALLNDILDFSKIEAGKLELERSSCNPRQVIDEIRSLFSETAQSKGLRIETAWHGPDHQRYWADPIRLRQMLTNLISNAIKFTSTGWIRMEASELRREGGKVLLEFAVTDTGAGIPQEKQLLLFMPFSQVDGSPTRACGGTGLGLSIVRSLAGLMGGCAGLESEQGKGARFWFRIEADVLGDGQESRNAQRGAGTGQEPAGLTGNILVVEDNPINRKVIEALLGRLGLRVIASAKNGREAVDIITGGAKPDLVLMDVQMPVMDGLEATRRIRQWEEESLKPRLPIVALTAAAFEEDRQRCDASGMDDFLSKPINVNDLTSLLVKWMCKKG